MSAEAAIIHQAAPWRAEPRPQVTRSGVGHVLIGRWITTPPTLPRIAAQVCMAALDGAPWPEGLVAHSCLLGEDGVSVLHYSQWTEPAAAHDRDLVAAISGVERQEVGDYRLHRSRIPAGETRRPDCVAIIAFDIDGGRPVAERFIEAMTSPDLPSPPGLLGGHYHISGDARRVVNYAEWTDLAANRAFVGSPAQGVFGKVLAASPRVRQAGAALYRPFVGRSAAG